LSVSLCGRAAHYGDLHEHILGRLEKGGYKMVWRFCFDPDAAYEEASPLGRRKRLTHHSSIMTIEQRALMTEP
jgi:hypothetical protein